MKERNEKIAAFIEKIGSPGLEGESQSVLLPSVLDNIGGGVGSNQENCSNSSDRTCYNAINGDNCRNYSSKCGESTNKRNCLNTDEPAPPDIIIGGNGGQIQPRP